MSEIQVLIGTGNAGKVKEIREIWGHLPITFYAPKDLGLSVSPEENGATFEENARIKACAFCEAANMAALADDSGLCVDFLGGAPGVYSARYSGEGATDEKNTAKLLLDMQNAAGKDRAAHFACVCAIVFPNGNEIVAAGTCEGEIALSPSGTGGFGYDPVFYVAEQGKTFSQMSEEEKNAISHRGRALTALAKKLETYFER